jgi:signal transduction histidine kinase
MPAEPGSRTRAELTTTAAVVVASVAVIGAMLLRLLAPPSPESTALSQLLAPLIALAACCVAILMVRRAPGVAWAALVGAIAIGVVEVVGWVRAWQPLVGSGTWPWLVLLAQTVLVMGIAIAALDAVRERRGTFLANVRSVWWLAIAGLLVAALGAGWALSVAMTEASSVPSSPDLLPIRTTARVALALIGAGLLVGIGRDLAGPAARARVRMRAEGGSAADRRPLIEFVRLLLDETLPGGAATRRAAVEAERARIAADLHAVLLPNLRQAAATAGENTASTELAVTLRTAVDDVEQLMHGRQSIVLEQFGLVAALEWLAERTEERSGIDVSIDLDGDVERPTELPVEVRRAAFRVALLAVDNVVRHAGATRVEARLAIGDGGLRLAIDDDGHGFETDRLEVVPGNPPPAGGRGRGLRDMCEEARAAGGTLTVASTGNGTRIELGLPVPARQGHHATRPGHLPSREVPSAGRDGAAPPAGRQ